MNFLAMPSSDFTGGAMSTTLVSLNHWPPHWNTPLYVSQPCSAISRTTHRPNLPDPPVTKTRFLRSGVAPLPKARSLSAMLSVKEDTWLAIL